jgi:hypothetical protein
MDLAVFWAALFLSHVCHARTVRMRSRIWQKYDASLIKATLSWNCQSLEDVGVIYLNEQLPIDKLLELD